MTMHLRSLLMTALLAGSASFAAEPVHWEQTGWGGGGYFWCCAYHPTDANVLYLGGDVAGVYKTTDQGRHWRFANRGLHNYAIYGMALAPSRPETIFVQTTDGLARSVDAGGQWEFLKGTGRAGLDLSANRGGTVRPIAVDPQNPDIVYAGGGKGTLAKSLDGGTTWQRLPYLETAAAGPKSLAEATPAFTGKGFLVLTYDSDRGEWGKNGRIEKAQNYPAGADWSAYRKLTGEFLVPPGAPKLEAQLVVQTGDAWLWQQSAFVVGKPGVWTELTLDLSGLKEMQKVRQAYVVVRSTERGYHGEVFVDTLALHTSAETQVAAGATALPAGVKLLADWEQPGNADGWQANRGTQDATFVTEVRQSAQAQVKEKGVIAAVALAPTNPRVVFVASTAFGLLRSTDAGATWTRLKAPAGAVCVTVSPRDEKLVYAACGKDGVQRSTDQGATWTALNTGLAANASLREVVLHPQRPEVLYAIAAQGWDGAFYRSEDGGQHWQSQRTMSRDLRDNPTLPDETGGTLPVTSASFSGPTNLAVHAANPELMFISGNWRNCLSTDGGRTWAERSRGADITCVQDIQFAAGRTYVVAMDEGSFASDDAGQSWRQLWPRKYDEAIGGHQWRLRVLPRAAGERLLTTVSPWSGQPNAVLLSDDGGKTFTKSAQGLPSYVPRPNTVWGQSYAKALAVDPTDPNVVYLGMDGDPEAGAGKTGGGLFKSTDGGRSWTQLPHQPPNRRAFFGLAVDPTNAKRLFWGTCGGGVFRSDDGGESWTHAFGNEGWVFNLLVAPSGAVFVGGQDLWRSDDHGATWKTVSKFPGGGAVVVGLAVDPANEQRLWVSRVTWGEDAGGGISATTDGGKSWADISGDIAYRKPLVLRYNPATQELWAGGVGLFKTHQ